MIAPLDTSGLRFLAGSPPELLIDRETGRPRLDSSGKHVQVLHVILLGDRVETVKVRSSEIDPGLVAGVEIAISGLTARPWAFNGRADVSYSAEKIEPVKARA